MRIGRWHRYPDYGSLVLGELSSHKGRSWFEVLSTAWEKVGVRETAQPVALHGHSLLLWDWRTQWIEVWRALCDCQGPPGHVSEACPCDSAG